MDVVATVRLRRRVRRTSRACAVALTLLLQACSGFLGDGTAGPRGSGRRDEPPVTPPAELPAQELPAQSRVLRMTHAEYERTVLALLDLPASAAPADGFIADDGAGRYGTDTRNLRVGEALYGDYDRAAWRLADRVVTSPELRAAIGADEPATFVASFLDHCLRGRAEPETVGAYQALHDACSARGATEGVRCVIAACLQDPEFVYRLELADGADGEGAATHALTGVERASRIAFLLSRQAPDAELVEAGRSGGLDDREEVVAAAARVAAGPAAIELVSAFHERWLGLRELEHGIIRSPERFPDLPSDAGAAMRAETLRFVTSVVGRGGGLRELLLDDTAIVDATTASLYGVEAALPAPDATFEIEAYPYALREGPCPAVDGFANLCSPTSTVTVSFVATTAGAHRLSILGYATQLGDEPTRGFVEIDGARTTFDVLAPAIAPREHGITVDLAVGAHTITVGLANDRSDATTGADRNLYVDRLDVRVGSSALVEVRLPSDERAGILTRLAFAALHADERSTSPILRGAWIARNLQCLDIAPPREGVPPLPADDGSPMTMRQRVALHTETGTCAGCHVTILNPPGFALERYDAIGRYVESDWHGLPVDSAVSMYLAGGPVPIADGVALSRALADQTEPYDCYVRAWMSFVYGREIAPGDLPLAGFLGARMQAGTLDVNGLVRELLASDGFLRRSPELLADAPSE